MEYIKENEILLIAETLFPLSRKDAREYFAMINEYSSVSRKLQKSEFNLNKKNLELSSKIKELEYLINYDSLTNIYSRQRILEELEKEYKRYKRLNETFTIAMIDIELSDNVKIIITFSAGLAEINLNDTISNLISCSDIQLYKVKDLGRNQIV